MIDRQLNNKLAQPDDEQDIPPKQLIRNIDLYGTDTGNSNSLTRNLLDSRPYQDGVYNDQSHTLKSRRSLKAQPEEIIWVPTKRKKKEAALPQLQNYKDIRTQEIMMTSFRNPSEQESEQKTSEKEQISKKQHEWQKSEPVNKQFKFVKNKKRKVEYESNFNDIADIQFEGNDGVTDPNAHDKHEGEEKVREIVAPNEAIFNQKGNGDSLEKKEAGHNRPNVEEVPKQASIEQEQEESEEQDDVKDMSFRVRTSIKLDEITDRRIFLNSTVPKGKMVQCTIKRYKSGFDIFRPQYDLFLSDECVYLMSGKKKAGNTSNYVISTDKGDFQSNGPNYLAKVRSNFVGTNFSIFDDGFNPKKSEPNNPNRKKRRVICSVHFENNLFGAKGPRKMVAYIADPELKSIPEGENDLKEYYESQHKNNFRQLINKAPRWNQKDNVYVLNFYGRVDKPSIKNFILVDKDQIDVINNIIQRDVMLFGRVGDDVFNLDVSYPLSPVQAFAITLTSFDFKLACE